MSVPIEDIAPPSGDAWKPEIGDTLKGIITYAGTFQRKSQFSGHNEEVLRIDIDQNGDNVTFWGIINTNTDGDGYPKRDARAVADAVRAAGATSIEPGGTLAIKRIDDVETEKGAAKAYQAQYKPPAAAPVVEVEATTAAVDDLLG